MRISYKSLIKDKVTADNVRVGEINFLWAIDDEFNIVKLTFEEFMDSQYLVMDCYSTEAAATLIAIDMIKNILANQDTTRNKLGEKLQKLEQSESIAMVRKNQPNSEKLGGFRI